MSASAGAGREGIQLFALRGVPDVRPGDDLAQLALAAASAAGVARTQGYILLVTHKVVSKAEGQLVDLREVHPSELALRVEHEWGKDARYIEVVLRESVRIVRMARGLIISETRHGFICANAGVDASNVSGGEVVCLLPNDPDDSAAALRRALAHHAGANVAVIITDSFG